MVDDNLFQASRADRRSITKDIFDHNQFDRLCRQGYHSRRNIGRFSPDVLLSIIIDGMDQVGQLLQRNLIFH